MKSIYVIIGIILQAGFPVNALTGGKSLDLKWNLDAQGLVNEAEKIVMQRVNTFDAAGKVIGAENIAYAWEVGVEPVQRQRIIWVKDKISDSFIWVQVDSSGSVIFENGKAKRWIERGWHMEATGDDGLKTIYPEVKWTHAISTPGTNGAWVNEEAKIIFFRDISISDDLKTDYWLAWEENVPVKDMKKIVYIKTKFMDDAGNLQDKLTWVSALDHSQRWDSVKRKFVPALPQ